MEAVNDLENIGDLIETNLVVPGRGRIGEGLPSVYPSGRS
jgi:hypothetical protein